MTTYAKYSEQFQKRRAMKASSLERKMIPTDREAYTEFLEVQLEKVSSALLASKGLEEKLQDANTRMDDFGDKVVNITKLVKLLQDFTEAQEEENNKAKENMQKIQHEINQRLSAVETGGDNYSEKIFKVEKKIDRLQTIVEELVSKDRFKKEEKPDRSTDSGYLLKIQQEELERAIGEIRNEMAIKNENFEIKVENYVQKLSEDLASDVKTLESRMNEFLRFSENEKIQEKVKTFESSTQDQRLSHTEILGSMERFMKDFRDEINRKIEMVMMESRTGADVEFVKEAIENMKHQILIEKRDRQEAIDLLTDKTLRKDSVIGSITDDLAIKLESLERKLKSKSRLSEKSTSKVEEDDELGDEFHAFKQKVYKEISEIKYALGNINKLDLEQTKSQGGKKRESFLREELEMLDKKFLGITDRLNEKLGGAIRKNTQEIINIQERIGIFEAKGKSGSPLRTSEYLSEKRNLEGKHKDTHSDISDYYAANRRVSSKERSLSGENSIGHHPSYFETLAKENMMNNFNLQASFGKPQLSGAKIAGFANGKDEIPNTSNFRRSRFSKEDLNNSSPDLVPSREIISKQAFPAAAGSTERVKKGKKKKSRKNSRASRSKSPVLSSNSRISNRSAKGKSLKRSLSATSVNREKEKLIKQGSFVFSPYSNRNSQNKEIVNRLALEKKMREEKIKQLVKKEQKGSAKENRSIKSNTVKQAASKHKNTLGKNDSKQATKKSFQNDSEVYTKNMKYDYNFVNTAKTKSNADKLRKLEKMYESLAKD